MKKLAVSLSATLLLLTNGAGSWLPGVGVPLPEASAAEESTHAAMAMHQGITVTNTLLGQVNPNWFGANIDYSDPVIADQSHEQGFNPELASILEGLDIREYRYGDSYLEWGSANDWITMAPRFDAKNNPPKLNDDQNGSPRQLITRDIHVRLNDVLTEVARQKANGRASHFTFVQNQANGSTQRFTNLFPMLRDNNLTPAEIDFELGHQINYIKDYTRLNPALFGPPMDIYSRGNWFEQVNELASNDLHRDGNLQARNSLSNGNADQRFYFRFGSNMIIRDSSPATAKVAKPDVDGRLGPYIPWPGQTEYPSGAGYGRDSRIMFKTAVPLNASIAFSYGGLFPGYQQYYEEKVKQQDFNQSKLYISKEGFSLDDMKWWRDFMVHNGIAFPGSTLPLVSLYHTVDDASRNHNGDGNTWPMNHRTPIDIHRAIMATAAGYDAVKIQSSAREANQVFGEQTNPFLYISQFGLNDAYNNDKIRPNSLSGTLYTALELMNFYDNPTTISGAATLSLASRNSVTNTNNGRSYANYSLIGYDAINPGAALSPANVTFFKTGPGLAYDFFGGFSRYKGSKASNRQVLQVIKPRPPVGIPLGKLTRNADNQQVIDSLQGIQAVAEVARVYPKMDEMTTVYLTNMTGDRDVQVPVNFEKDVQLDDVQELSSEDGSLTAENLAGTPDQIQIAEKSALAAQINDRRVDVTVPKNSIVKITVASSNGEKRILVKKQNEGIGIDLSSALLDSSKPTLRQQTAKDDDRRALDKSKAACEPDPQPSTSKRCEILVPAEELTEGQTYTFSVETYDPNGTFLGVSNEVSMIADFHAPVPADDLDAVRVSETGQPSVRLSWSQSTDNPGSGMKLYRILRDDVEGYLAELSPAASTYEDAYELHTGQTYTYRIEACDNTDQCSISEKFSLTLAHDVVPPTAPGKPSLQYGLAQDATGLNYPTVSFQWKESTDRVAVRSYTLLSGDNQVVLDDVEPGEAYDLRLIKQAFAHLAVPVTGTTASLKLVARDDENSSDAGEAAGVQLPNAPLHLSELRRYDKVTLGGRTWMIMDDPQSGSAVRKLMDMTNDGALHQWNTVENNDYANSALRTWLEGAYTNGLPAEVRAWMKLYEGHKVDLLGEEYDPSDPEAAAHMVFPGKEPQWTRLAVPESTADVYAIDGAGSLAPYPAHELLTVHPIVYMDAAKLVSVQGGTYVPDQAIVAAALNKSELDLAVGDTGLFILSVDPSFEYGTNKWMVWNSENPAIASIELTNDWDLVNVQGVSPGQTTISAITAVGVRSAPVTVNAQSNIPVPQSFQAESAVENDHDAIALSWMGPGNSFDQQFVAFYKLVRTDGGFTATIPKHSWWGPQGEAENDLAIESDNYTTADANVKSGHLYTYGLWACLDETQCSEPVYQHAGVPPAAPTNFSYVVHTNSQTRRPDMIEGRFTDSGKGDLNHTMYFEVYRTGQNQPQGQELIGYINRPNICIKGQCVSFANIGRCGDDRCTSASFEDWRVTGWGQEFTYEIYAKESPEGMDSDNPGDTFTSQALKAKVTTGQDIVPPPAPGALRIYPAELPARDAAKYVLGWYYWDDVGYDMYNMYFTWKKSEDSTGKVDHYELEDTQRGSIVLDNEMDGNHCYDPDFPAIPKTDDDASYGCAIFRTGTFWNKFPHPLQDNSRYVVSMVAVDKEGNRSSSAARGLIVYPDKYPTYMQACDSSFEHCSQVGYINVRSDGETVQNAPPDNSGGIEAGQNLQSQTLAEAEQWSLVRIDAKDWLVIDKPGADKSSRKLMLKDFAPVSLSWNGAMDNNYLHSNIRSWLNGEFYDSLSAFTKKLMKPLQLDLGTANNQSPTVGQSGERWVTDRVGLLQADEYDAGNPQHMQYLAGNRSQWLLNPDAGSTKQARLLTASTDPNLRGQLIPMVVASQEGVRPVISIGADQALASGDGTANSPYELKPDTAEEVPQWSYVSWAGQTWLTYDGANGQTKLFALDALPATAWGATNDYAASGVKAALQNWYNSLSQAVQPLLADTLFDLGPGVDEERRFVKDKVGLLQWNEYDGASAEQKAKLSFAGQAHWLMEPSGEKPSEAMFIQASNDAGRHAGEVVSGAAAQALALHPVIRLQPGVKLAGGSGTAGDPYRLYIPADTVTIDGALRMGVGEKTMLTAKVLPSEATNPAVRWTSASPEIATVTENGGVTGIAEGLAKLSACTVDRCERVTVAVGNAKLPTERQGELSLVDGVRTFSGEAAQADYADAGLVDANVAGGLTIAGWVKAESVATHARILDFGNGPGMDNILLTRRGNSNDMNFQVITGSGTSTLTAPNVWETNTWMHVAVTLDAQGQAKLYKNGVQVASQSGFRLPTDVVRTKNYIGKSNWSADALFKGQMSDLQLYTTALDAETIRKQAQVWSLLGAPRTFDAGANSGVNLGTVKMSFDQGVSAAGWVRFDSTQDTSHIIDFGSGTNGNLILGRWGTSNQLYWQVLRGTQTFTLTTPTTDANGRPVIENGVWMHVAATIDANGNGVIYKNGAPLATQAGMALPETLAAGRTSSYIGLSNWSVNRPFAGQLADLAVYGQALEPGEVAELAQSRKLLDEARTFNGTSDSVSLGTSRQDYSHGFAAQAWVKYDGFAMHSRIFDFGNGAGRENVFLGNDGLSNSLYFMTFGNGTATRMDAANVLETGKWTHIAVSVDAQGNGVLYKDGLAIVRKSGLIVPQSVERTNNYLGQSNWTVDALFQGSMKEVSVYARPLSEAEVRASYLSGAK